ncbi:MAG: hypothetical protein KDK62_07330 [Chlamydiia bacterium]|nr:hypothetical protein [Chlamydiia bacterium]
MRRYSKALLCTLLILTSCVRDRLIVFTEVVSYENRASYHVCTPDPRLGCPDRGQRLFISWFLPNCYEPGLIYAKIRFKNLQEIERVFPICDARGHMTYNVLNEDYCKTGGILTYQIFLMQGDEVIDTATHALWTEIIRLNE